VKYGQIGSLQSVIPGKETSARFDSSSGTVSGNGACNTYNAQYNEHNGNLHVGTVMSTMMLCYPSEVNQQENDFFKILSDAQTYEVQGNELRILSSTNRILIFEPK
jgi:heat shock protein HslJ